MTRWEVLGIERLQSRVMWRVLRRELVNLGIAGGIGAGVIVLLVIGMMRGGM